MAKPLRIEPLGALYHVISRIDKKADIYLDDNDRGLFLETLDDVCILFNWIVHAYCLMRNYYHLLNFVFTLPTWQESQE